MLGGRRSTPAPPPSGGGGGSSFVGRACSGGVCIDTNNPGSCRRTVSGRCRGPASIKCCIDNGQGAVAKRDPIPCFGGAQGVCLDSETQADECDGTFINGYCPSPSYMKCCAKAMPGDDGTYLRVPITVDDEVLEADVFDLPHEVYFVGDEVQVEVTVPMIKVTCFFPPLANINLLTFFCSQKSFCGNLHRSKSLLILN